MLKLLGKWSTPSAPSLPGPLWPSVVTPDKFLSMGQIELNCSYVQMNCLKLTVSSFNCVNKKLCTYAKLNCLK